jgi:hypothetical protein
MQNAAIYSGCPAISYSRFTDWRNSSDVHSAVVARNGFKDTNAWRAFLTENARSLIEANRTEFISEATCASHRTDQPDPFGHIAYWEDVQRKLGLRA